jgi:hypothetical protein
MVDEAAARLGRKGGQNSRKNLTSNEASSIARAANEARWAAYYEKNPEKSKARLEREAKKGTAKRGRPSKGAKGTK